MPYTVVQLTTHLSDGDTMHRLTWPIQALGALPEFRVIDVHYMSPYTYQLAFEADLLILSMISDAELVPIVRWRNARGKPTVFEVNNNMFDLHPLTPVFDLWSSPSRRADCLYMMSLADLVQVSTPALEEAFRPYCQRIAVFANQIADPLKSLPPKSDNPFIVGWAGSLSHIADLAHIAGAVSKWIMDHDNVALWVMGHEPMAKVFRLPPEKMKFVLWGGMDAYAEFLKGVHVGLAPLQDIPFNRARSDVKWLEYAAAGCVFVGQRLPTYAQVEEGKTGFLFGDNAELLRILDKLYQDRGLLESVRRAAFEYVTQRRRYDLHIPQRADAYRKLLERRVPEGADKWILHETSKFPRPQLPDPLPGYLAIKVDAEEQKVLMDLHSRRPNIPETLLTRIEDRYGDFHLICYARALTALVRGDVAGAERHLRRSLSLYPAALASLQLLAQVLMGTRRLTEAKGMLAHAAQWHEACVPIYRDLVSLAEQQSDWDSAITATEQWEKHCPQDPIPRLKRGYLMIRSGRMQEGLQLMAEALDSAEEPLRQWRPRFSAEASQILRQADPLVAKEAEWQDLVLKAVEMFPYGIWLPTRASEILYERGDYERGKRLAQAARDRLLALEWQRTEGTQFPPEYRTVIEFYRMACEELARNKE